MKRVGIIMLIAGILISCNAGNGELIGVQGREPWYQPDPFGMLFIPMGSFHMGENDQDVARTFTSQDRPV